MQKSITKIKGKSMNYGNDILANDNNYSGTDNEVLEFLAMAKEFHEATKELYERDRRERAIDKY